MQQIKQRLTKNQNEAWDKISTVNNPVLRLHRSGRYKVLDGNLNPMFFIVGSVVRDLILKNYLVKQGSGIRIK